MERFLKSDLYSSAPLSFFFDSVLSSRCFLRVSNGSNGFTTVNVIKTDTLCNNENKKKYNIKHHIIQRRC